MMERAAVFPVSRYLKSIPQPERGGSFLTHMKQDEKVLTTLNPSLMYCIQQLSLWICLNLDLFDAS